MKIISYCGIIIINMDQIREIITVGILCMHMFRTKGACIRKCDLFDTCIFE